MFVCIFEDAVVPGTELILKDISDFFVKSADLTGDLVPVYQDTVTEQFGQFFLGIKEGINAVAPVFGINDPESELRDRTGGKQTEHH